MSGRLSGARVLASSWGGACLLLTAAILPVHADTIEAYVRPFDGISVCPISHVMFDSCTGLQSDVWAHPDLDLDVDPCEAVLLTGSWGWTLPQCRAFIVTDVTPTVPICGAQPGLWAERVSSSRYEWSWAPVPCVNSYDLVYTIVPIGTPPGMDEFHCGANDFGDSGGGGIVVNDPEPESGLLTALLVRGQQGALATNHYGWSSSGEPRRPLNDCHVDLWPSLPSPPRTPQDRLVEIVP